MAPIYLPAYPDSRGALQQQNELELEYGRCPTWWPPCRI